MTDILVKLRTSSSDSCRLSGHKIDNQNATGLVALKKLGCNRICIVLVEEMRTQSQITCSMLPDLCLEFFSELQKP